MNANIISEDEYKSYLNEIEALIAVDPDESTPEAQRLKLLASVVELYEKSKFFFDRPTPIEAIQFRMNEMGLSQKDVSTYFGGKNRVSEILSGSRPLTLSMIKALHKYLKIPLEVLVHEDVTDIKFDPEKLYFDQSIVSELVKIGWINKIDKSFSNIKDAIVDFLEPIGGLGPSNVLCRQSTHISVRNNTNEAALFLWSAKVLIDAKKIQAEAYKQELITLDVLKEIARLSVFDKGPLLAVEALKKYGIKLVIVPHLTSTYLDGGVLMDDAGAPVIGLTLRYDRLDNFWHTLLHELAHILKHLKVVDGPFLDDIDHKNSDDPIEKEADQIARESAIPRERWRSSDIMQIRTKESVIKFAKEMHVSPAIVAGRVHFETKNYKLFPELLGTGVVRNMFGVQ